MNTKLEYRSIRHTKLSLIWKLTWFLWFGSKSMNSFIYMPIKYRSFTPDPKAPPSLVKIVTFNSSSSYVYKKRTQKCVSKSPYKRKSVQEEKEKKNLKIKLHSYHRSNKNIIHKFTRSRNTYYIQFVGRTNRRRKVEFSDSYSRMRMWTDLAFAKSMALTKVTMWSDSWPCVGTLWPGTRLVTVPILFPYCERMMRTRLALLTSPSCFFVGLNGLKFDTV